MAVLAIIGSHLPSALRIFLLTLAVVDDLIAIAIIAFVYTERAPPRALLLALLPLGLYTFLVQKFRGFFGTQCRRTWLILLPLGAVAWALVHRLGHPRHGGRRAAGFRRAGAAPGQRRPGGGTGPCGESSNTGSVRSPAGIAVPVFAFFSAGVAVGGCRAWPPRLTDPVAVGIVLGPACLGKPAESWAPRG